MELITEKQISPVESEVLARISIIRPILTSLLLGIKKDILDELGGIDNIKLKDHHHSYYIFGKYTFDFYHQMLYT